MKKIIMLVLMVLGTVAQAQTFDFSCADDEPIQDNQVTVTYKVKYGSADEDVVSVPFTFVDGGAVFKNGMVFNLPTGYAASESISAKTLTQLNAVNLSHSAISNNATSIALNTYISPSTFEYDQDNFDFVVDLSSKIDYTAPAPPEVDATIRFRYKGTHPFTSNDYLSVKHTFVEGESKSATVSFTLPAGYATNSSENIGNTNHNYFKIGLDPSAWSNNATVVYVKATLHGNFSYGASDFTVGVQGENYVDYTAPEFDVTVVVDSGVSSTTTFVKGGSKVENLIIPLGEGTHLINPINGALKTYGNVRIEYGAHSADEEELRIKVTLIGDVDYTQDDQTVTLINTFDSYIGEIVPESVNIKVKIADGVHKTVTVTEGSNNTVPVTVHFNLKADVIADISEGIYLQSATTKLLHKISKRSVGANSVGVTLKTFTDSADWEDFDYTRDDFTLDLSTTFAPYVIALGDVADFIDIDNDDGTANDISGQSRNYRFRVRISSSIYTDYKTVSMSGDNQVATIGDSNIVGFPGSGMLSVPNNHFPGTTSEDPKFNDRRVSGGKYNNWVKISEPSYGGFVAIAKWNNQSNSIQIVVITDTGWEWDKDSTVQLGTFDLFNGVAK